jgi:O-antigen/teichoic acid export membrane protein
MNEIISRIIRSYSPIAALFIIRISFALGIFLCSSVAFKDSEFIVFNQLFLLFSLINLISAGGTVSGIVSFVAHAREDSIVVASCLRSALIIWSILNFTIVSITLIFSSLIFSGLAIADEPYWIVPVLAGLAALSGLGQIFGSVLIGQLRSNLNIAVQLTGMIVGGTSAVWLIFQNHHIEAILLYAVGSALTSLISAILIRSIIFKMLSVSADLVGEMARYSATFVYTASLTPITFFLVRYIHELNFGTPALRDLITATRISDVNTQFVGLIMSQLLLPRVAANLDKSNVQRVVLESGIISVFAMTFSFVAFILISDKIDIIMPLATGSAGIALILAFLIGDIVRVPQSIALNLALAEERFLGFAAVETAGAILMIATLLVTTRLNWPIGPGLAYAAGYAISGGLAMSIWFRTRSRS